MIEGIGKSLDGQRQRVRAVLRGSSPEQIQPALTNFWRDEPQTLEQALLPLFDDVAAAGAQQGISRLPVGVNWSGVNEAVLQLAQERCRQYAAETTGASKRQIGVLVSRWIETGGTLDELLTRVDRVYPGHHAKTEAVTQVTSVFSEGQRSSWAASDVVAAYRWDTAEDDLVCPRCGPRNGNEYDIDDAAALPPAHYGCRCDISPVVKTPDELGGEE